jgi:D-3-phosphoglycerate dehydrogenase
MATNKKKIFVTESMSQQGRALLKERDDIELVEFPNMISASDFEAMLKAQAPVHGVALGATRFGEPELEASKDMKVVTRIGVGYDAVDVPALSRRKIPLMVAGSANSPSVAEQAMFMMLTLAKRAVEMHSIVKDGKWGARLGMLPYDLFGKTVLIVGFGRIGTRTAKRCLAMEMNVLVYDPYKSAAEIRAARLRAGQRSRCGVAARRFRQHPLPEDAGDGRNVQCGAAEAHETCRLSDQHCARRDHRRAGVV